ncbi:hypothetical protein [Luteimonas sp. MC1825]|uniref:hypothetical protein n=1 Tax=Luteimonas sp. MC1825 TaxID=2761107 RepID=UPI00160831F9|nr:hypothetical protein [Luteimonas sp. MC1825]MBB6600631.1 hypothetical protein [Luteimonas sp. MC1825]QOC88229.1 hypothetical protein IDM46_00140 [Luteimonas sp. MC1825]
MTTFSDIFVETPADLSLQAFAHVVFPLISIEQYEERESSHYVDDTYFRSVGSNLEVTACFTDDSDLAKYRFWLPICSEDQARLAPEAAEQFALIISGHGWRCFIPTGAWYRNGWSGEGRLYEA